MKKIKIGLAGLGALGEMHIANIQRKFRRARSRLCAISGRSA